ncbi:MAG: DUF547 domain-containing protein [bacterium]|nr:DUF547 domain-containing protein [bacterium]
MTAIVELLFAALLVLSSSAATAAPTPLPNEAWGQLLATHVESGRVDYGRIKDKPDLLKKSLQEFRQISRQEYGKWNREAQIAFWINAYNLFTIKAVVDNYPPRGWNLIYPKLSIRQIGGVWDATVYRTAGQVVSLSQIEHKILRGLFKEPRIHFALVCASLGCPPLLAEPYDEENLEQRLEFQVYRFLEDPEHGLRWEPEARILYLSKIFFWFGLDFDYYYRQNKRYPDWSMEKRNAVNFVWSYLPQEILGQLEESEFKVKYLDYDWSLNDSSSAPNKER